MSQNCQSPEDIERELLDKTNAYLRCRSGGMDAAPPLVEAWQRFYCTFSSVSWPSGSSDRTTIA